MNKLFYPKLAAQNLHKNRQFYLPYILTVLGTAAAFYILAALTNTKPTSTQTRYYYLSVYMSIGLVVVGLFSVIFLFYTNSFLMKRRGKELGLYNVLGMGKRNIAAMLGFETMYVALIGIVGGIALGTLLQKLMTMLVTKLMGGVDVKFPFQLSPAAMALTAILFGAILLLTLLVNLGRVAKLRPVELMRSGSSAEREPKTRWLLAVLGVGCLGAGYWIAVAVKSAMEALGLYFVAVLLVILGTYCLFTAVSIAVLKLLRSNKRYYYQTGHFIGVSGMLYRMKRNAVGLANICVLSTMVLVMVSGTLSLYLGTEASINVRYPADINVNIRYDAELEPGQKRFDGEKTLERLVDACDRLGVPATGAKAVSSLCFTAQWTGSCFQTVSVNDRYDSFSNSTMLVFLPAKDYESMTGKHVDLNENEVLAAGKMPKELSDTLMLDFRERETAEPVGIEYFKIVGTDAEFEGLPQYKVYIATIYYFIVPDDAALDGLWALQEKAYGERGGSSIEWYAYLDTGASAEENLRLCGYDEARAAGQYYTSDMSGKALNNLDFVGIASDSDVGHWDIYTAEPRDSQKGEMIAMNGGFFFLGIFLGVLFIMATVLIIYYKQVSEGYEDRARFQIMQQVGLQKSEIRRSVNHQLLIVFFAPLLVSAVHVAFDFRLIRMLLTFFQQNDVMLILRCSLGTFGAFALLYLIVYRVTARAYHKIVE